MVNRWPTKQTALVGAVLGAGAGLLLLGVVDPTDGAASDAYEGGAKVGYLVRYAILGAAAAVLAARVLKPDEGTPNSTLGLYLAGLLVVLGLAVLPPVLDDDDSSERAGGANPGAELLADATEGCVDGVRRRFGARADLAGLNVDAYCGCLVNRLIAEGQRRGVSLETLVGQLQTQGAPPWAKQEADACTRRSMRN